MGAEAYSSAALRHGPIALIGEEVAVLVIVPTGAVSADLERLLEELSERRAVLLVVSDRPELLQRGGRPYRCRGACRSGCRRWWRWCPGSCWRWRWPGRVVWIPIGRGD
ncbi:hypothetical protein OO015_11280 [Thermomicrobium sp. 4228-Ro]|uniref:hypothetical protein n=1 Tax=Thermomicrobium sp. 4228-Ro TaxID=2993937 RepID=UPI00224976CB|nr:hypothetical protein [Thermomicrobium sp. 4228-Ro]MCX2728072.1 hypothetical protein [Thermomicrobium sp. 4228-Ro]